jgi:hypothetical protein
MTRDEINAKRRERYATDPYYRRKVLERSRQWWIKHPEEYAKYRDRMREKYAALSEDERKVVQAKRKERREQRKRDDPEYRRKLLRAAIKHAKQRAERYLNDEDYRNKCLARWREWYSRKKEESKNIN